MIENKLKYFSYPKVGLKENKYMLFVEIMALIADYRVE